MLGMVFTELIDMIEQQFSPELADAVIQAANLPHGGAYTAVGYYPHEEIVSLVLALSKQTGTPVPDLVTAFGRYLLGRFSTAYPQLFAAQPTLFDFLASIDAEIHREVRKLYPSAQLPQFTVLNRDERQLTLAYESPRSMEPLAQGLIEGAALHYQTPVQIVQQAGEVDGRAATLFVISRQD